MKAISPNEKKDKIRSVVALCAMAFVTLAASATSPVLPMIADAFPSTPMSLISSIATISSITTVPFTILSGMIAGKKVRYRTLTCIGLAVQLVGGFLPYFATTIWEILICRAVMGIGLGLLNPMIATLTLSLFSPAETSRQFGNNTIASCIGAIFFQILGGLLCEYGWRVPFVTQLALLPILVTVFLLLPEPGAVAASGSRAKRDGRSLKDIVTPHVLKWSLLDLSFCLFFYPFVTEISGIVVNNGYGSASTAAVVLSVFTGAGVIGGYAFYYLNKVFGRFLLCLDYLLLSAAYVLIAAGRGVTALMIAACLFGIGYGVYLPVVSYRLGRKLAPEFRASSTAALQVFTAIGTFSSPFVIDFLRKLSGSPSDRISFVFGIGYFLVVSAAVAVINLRTAAEASREGVNGYAQSGGGV